MPTRPDFINSLGRWLREQANPEEREALARLLLNRMQSRFDRYIDRRGDDAVEFEEDESGVELLILRAFGPLRLDESVDEMLDDFPGLAAEDVADLVDEGNRAGARRDRTAEGDLQGWWIDLVRVDPARIGDRKLRVDVFYDPSGDGAIEFGVDRAQTILETAVLEEGEA